MKIEYVNKFRDKFSFMVYNLMHSPVYIIILLLACISISPLVWKDITYVTNTAIKESGENIPNNVINFIHIIQFIIHQVIFLIVLTCIGLFASSLTLITKNDKGFLTKHIITLSKDELVEETIVNRTTFSWETVFKIGKTKNYIYLYTGPNQAHVIPKRELKNEEWNDFYSYINNRINS